MLLRDFLRDEAEYSGVDIEEIEIDGGNTVLSGEHGSDHVVANEAQFDQIEGEAATMFALVVESLSQILRANKIFAYENFA
jgi:hypothetical protein